MATPDQPQSPAWKEEVAKRRIQNERAKDVERRWEHLINTEGANAPEWMRETALRKKAARDKETATGVPPWMQEMRRRNSNLTKKMQDNREIEAIDESERAPKPEAIPE